jgi:hypothetical protein
MTSSLDLGDIQGNVLQGYGRYGFPHVRYFVFHFGNGPDGRKAVQELLPYVTTSARWDNPEEGAEITTVQRPKVTLNIAFTWLVRTAVQKFATEVAG